MGALRIRYTPSRAHRGNYPRPAGHSTGAQYNRQLRASGEYHHGHGSLRRHLVDRPAGLRYRASRPGARRGGYAVGCFPMRFLSIALGLIAAGFAVSAQRDRGTITGTVSDPAGAVVAGAAVEARNVATGAVYP